MNFRPPGPICQFLSFFPLDAETLARVWSPPPAAREHQAFANKTGRTLSGHYWVDWANINAKNSQDVQDLARPFRDNVMLFMAALKEAGATLRVSTTRRASRRAYLFHWSWLVGLAKVKPALVPALAGVDIEWNHGDDNKSQAGAREMIHGFGLAVPPKSKVAPALHSNHIAGNAIDVDILWKAEIKIKRKNGSLAAVAFMADPNANTKLHEVGASFGVIKHLQDAPHWSINGR